MGPAQADQPHQPLCRQDRGAVGQAALELVRVRVAARQQPDIIALDLSCNPQILIADEPTTALDVTVQAQLRDLMNRLREEFESSIVLITHNLGVVSQMCDQIAVMYLGKWSGTVWRGTFSSAPSTPVPRAC